MYAHWNVAAGHPDAVLQRRIVRRPAWVARMVPRRRVDPAEPHGVLDAYVRTSPSPQNAIDIFAGTWSSRVPLDVTSGSDILFDDFRIRWIREQTGPIDEWDVLELGPLEGGHTAMLAALGASVTAIEANARAYLKCLIVKELLELSGCHFLYGDFFPYLQDPPRQFDLVVASGVLYHAVDPPRLLELIAGVTSRLGLWTHYYDDEVIAGNERLARVFAGEPPETRSFHGQSLTLHRRKYLEALQWGGFCGGPETYARWLDRASLLAALEAVGFADVRIGNEDRQHPNGPGILLYASK